EVALADVQAANTQEIRSWLSHAKPGAKMAFSGTFDHPVGRILYQGSTTSVEGNTAIAVLQADPSTATGYHIVTGYIAP
ncbi:MAG: Bacterial CdiA-CT RNAse domain, partial [Actinomycetota bacterium]|nr:Bacterial CdiA-CT RNAse domain [Actinomycetota bacterium]